jgi:transcriptional regulator with XRE-family HTH domain
MSFGQHLQALRVKAGLSQAGLAAKTGISVYTIQSWETDRRAPGSLAMLVKLAEGLNVPIEAFAAGVEDPAEDEEFSSTRNVPGRAQMGFRTAEDAPKKPRGRPRKRQPANHSR